MEVVIHLLRKLLFGWLWKERYLKPNHQKTCVYPKPGDAQILCKIGNNIIKYKEICSSVRAHLSFSIILLFFYESGCMNFKIGNNVTQAVSLGGIFCISVLDFVSHDFLSLFFLESDSHCFAWWSSLTKPFFSLPVVCVCVVMLLLWYSGCCCLCWHSGDRLRLWLLGMRALSPCGAWMACGAKRRQLTGQWLRSAIQVWG